MRNGSMDQVKKVSRGKVFEIGFAHQSCWLERRLEPIRAGGRGSTFGWRDSGRADLALDSGGGGEVREIRYKEKCPEHVSFLL